MVFLLPFTILFFKIFINVFAFLYVKVNCKSVKKYPFLLAQKNADVSIFVEIQG